MKTSWPSKLILKFISDDKLVTNLLVYFILLSKSKNNFSIGHFITNKNGEIELTHKIMTEAIKKAKAEYPMDYDGTVEESIGLEVIVETMDELNNRINSLSEFYPNEATILENLTKECSNSHYIGKKVVYKQPIDYELAEINLQRM